MVCAKPHLMRAIKATGIGQSNHMAGKAHALYASLARAARGAGGISD